MDNLQDIVNKAGEDLGKVQSTPTDVLPTETTNNTVNQNTITSDMLQSEPALEVPPVTQQDNSSFVEEIADTNTLSQQLADKEAQARAEADQSEADVRAIQNEILGITESRQDLEDQFDITGKTQALNDITNKIEAKRLKNRRQIERIQTQSGLTREQKNAQISEIERVNAREMADLAIVQSAANRDLLTAETLIEKKINNELEPLKLRYEFQKDFLDRNEARLTTAERDLLQSKIRDNERAYEQEKSQLERLENTKLKLLDSAATQGAPASVLEAIQRAESPEKAIVAAGQYGTDILERQYKQAQLRKINFDIAQAQAASLDTGNGFLDDKDIQNIDNSPQGKKIKTLSDLKIKLNNYQGLVNEYGFESFGQNKASLENAYKELQLSYKEAANLGVLNGPDLTLIESAIRSATPGIGGQIANIASFGQGTRNLVANLEQAQQTLNSGATQNLEELYARNPKYRGSLYVESLILPFQGEIITNDTESEMDAVLSQ